MCVLCVCYVRATCVLCARYVLALCVLCACYVRVVCVLCAHDVRVWFMCVLCVFISLGLVRVLLAFFLARNRMLYIVAPS